MNNLRTAGSKALTGAMRIDLGIEKRDATLVRQGVDLLVEALSISGVPEDGRVLTMLDHARGCAQLGEFNTAISDLSEVLQSSSATTQDKIQAHALMPTILLGRAAYRCRFRYAAGARADFQSVLCSPGATDEHKQLASRSLAGLGG